MSSTELLLQVLRIGRHLVVEDAPAQFMVGALCLRHAVNPAAQLLGFRLRSEASLPVALHVFLTISLDLL